MNLTSPAFNHTEAIPSQYTCDGIDVNPPLLIADVPSEAMSLVLIVDDPDAPAGTWIHWAVWDIDPQTTTIKEDSVPEGVVEGMTSFGDVGYGGPCPPSGEHRYFFRLYALDTQPELPADATAGDVMDTMEGHIVAQAELMGTYQRA